MRAFLLAAGKGSRISKNIPNIPKCTLDVGGQPLIRKTVEMLLKNGIDVTVIVGYRYREIIRVLEGCPVHIVYNPFYDVTNSIGSLWMAQSQGLFDGDEDTIIANGDVFWSQEILDFMKAKAVDEEMYMLGDSGRVLDGDYFFGTEGGILKRYGKELTLEERDCEYVGIAWMSSGFVPVFLKRLDEMIDDRAMENGGRTRSTAYVRNIRFRSRMLPGCFGRKWILSRTINGYWTTSGNRQE